ncbi:MoaD/ThiS family protein [Aeromicrobium phragmitis]|uniref:MoaD/ThiS family protein n=1 Tax=Aeromicrobium phragmitis TaxID=2478914 RepID=A0A3L8PR82_9ACTN|nr:MoaD/ThiS family protein [Aeromicrobium phragmitis]RLV56968.1 MoaD/ThiS family protein [Aeromicrobium phragmitis]
MTMIRLFAAARHAVGQGEFTLDGLGLTAPTTVGTVVQALSTVSPAARPVLEGCSVLVDGERRGFGGQVENGTETVDILPPFAGG